MVCVGNISYVCFLIADTTIFVPCEWEGSPRLLQDSYKPHGPADYQRGNFALLL